jgi:subtilisin family serine protease
MMKNNLKIFLICFSVGSILTIGIHAWFQLFYLKTENKARLARAGVPQVVDLVPSEGEKSVLLNDESILKNLPQATANQSSVSANKAWTITQGDRRIIVAIIDTGADIRHPDLAENIWVNPGETGFDSEGHDKSTNGKDNDGNGYINDIHGWNFVGNNNDLTDNHGHGTHIAGIIGAVGGNGIGISGICPKVSLMVLKYYDPYALHTDTVKNTARAIRYAVDMGANIINYSDGGIEPNDEEFAAVKYAQDHGVLFVAAAGNEHSNSDVSHYYPADYNLSNIISVTAINALANVLSSSNYGTKTVHIAAPGEGIESTLPGGHYGYLTGTSQATAFVSGVAALILSHNKDFSAEQVKRQIVATADELPGLRNKTASGGKLNSYAALAIQPDIPATGIAHVTMNQSHEGIRGGPNSDENFNLDEKENPLLKALNRGVAGHTTQY